MTPQTRTIPSLRLACLLLLASARAASAQSVDDGFAVERLRLASTRDGVIGVEAGSVLPHQAWTAGAWLGYARDPLVVVGRSDKHQVGTLVQDRVGGAVVGALGLWGRGAVAIELPFVLSQRHAPGPLAGSVAPLHGGGIGAVRVAPRVALVRTGLDLAAQVGVRFPSVTRGSYVGARGFELEPELLASRTLGRWRVAGDLGAVVRERHQVLDLEGRQR